MKLTELSKQLCQNVGPLAGPSAVAWLETSRSLTVLMAQSAEPVGLQHSLVELGWVTTTEQEQAIWSGFTPGEQAWQRVISFFVEGACWLRARVLIPTSSLSSAAGLSLQYCGAQSLGTVLFQDPELRRSALGYSCEQSPEQGLSVTRHGLYEFYTQPLVISECFSQTLWQRPLPKERT